MSNPSSTTNNSNHKLRASRPLAALRAPSARDIEIYKRVKILDVPQNSVACYFHLDPSRVSQIIKKVRRWIAAGGGVTDPQVRDHAARQSLTRAASILRLQRAIELATRAAEGRVLPRTTTRCRYESDTEVWRQETSHNPPEVDLKAIRLLGRLTESLHKLQDQERAEESTPRQRRLFELDLYSEQDLIEAVFEQLSRWRSMVEANGSLPACGNVNALVAGAIDTVLGTNLAADYQSTGAPPDTEDDWSRPRPTKPLPKPTAHSALNMSAALDTPNSATDAATTPCDNPNDTSLAQNPKHERPEQPPAGSKPAPGAPPTNSTSSTLCDGLPTPHIPPSAPPIAILMPLACVLLLLSGPLASTLGGFPQPTAKVPSKPNSQWKLERVSTANDGASNPSHRPRSPIDLVTFSKSEQSVTPVGQVPSSPKKTTP